MIFSHIREAVFSPCGTALISHVTSGATYTAYGQVRQVLSVATSVSLWTSGFHSGFLDFWISDWISGFQIGFPPTVYEISLVTDPSVLSVAYVSLTVDLVLG